MKACCVLAALVAWPPRAAEAAALVGSAARARSGDSRGSTALRIAVTPEEMARCEQYMSSLYTQPLIKKRILPKIVRNCRKDMAIKDARKVCPHLGAALAFAMDDVPEDEELTPGQFCTYAEERMEGLEGAVNVPNLGSGAMDNSQVSPQCLPTVEAVIGTDGTLKTDHLPDFWYALCMNQDCAHFLPSRTKWCDTVREPTHSAMVCEAARGFAKFKIGGRRLFGRRPPEDMKGPQICDLYSNFMEEVSIDLKTWRAVAHGEKGPPLNKQRKPIWHHFIPRWPAAWSGASTLHAGPLVLLIPALAALMI
jgi:hypothetical protein